MKYKKYKTNGGAAMMILVIFFVLISLSILIGIVTPVTREFKVASSNFNSKQAYFLAESGTEDAFYRIKNSKKISASENITLGANTATTTITTVGSNQKQIVALGDSGSNQRKVSLAIATGAGVVFKYGTQAGQGGITFKENSGLTGSLYSNGNIIGAQHAFITGDAFAANAPAVNADQTNGDVNNITNNINFANANATQDFAQSFQISTDGPVNKAQLYIKKIGAPANATVRIVTDSSGSPSTTNVATGTLNANLVTTNYGWIDVTFTTNPQMVTGITYWLVIDASTSSANYYNIVANSSGYTNGIGKIGAYNGTWNSTTPTGLDGYFSIFLGGTTSSITNMQIGTGGTGNAYAHTITGSTVTGTIYCQVGSSNNKNCNTSQSDPVQENYPVSDANIAQWKSDALAGGVINGNYSISGTQSLGPKKIVGNLDVSGILTLTNTIWVTGNITFSGTVKLAPSYNATTGIIIADGYIDVGNNTIFQDSGTTGSYILVLTTSNCDSGLIGNPCGSGRDAITASNNSNIIIANAQKGSINFSNNANVKESVANRIYLSNNAYISYGSGLINVNFTSGPSGSWNIGSWKESQ